MTSESGSPPEPPLGQRYEPPSENAPDRQSSPTSEIATEQAAGQTPAPAPEGTDRATEDPGAAGRPFRTAVALAMAAVAISTAIVAYHAALWGTKAAEEHGTALLQMAERDRVEQHINIVVAEDSRLFGLYSQHDVAARDISIQADAARATDPTTAAVLDLRVQAHQDAIDALWPLFQGAAPTGTAGQQTLNAEEERAALEAGDRELTWLEPDSHHLEAALAGARAVLLIAAIAGLIGALLLLTIAAIYRRYSRIFAVLGIAVAFDAVGTTRFLDQRPSILILWVVLGICVAFGVYLLLQRYAPKLFGRTPLAPVARRLSELFGEEDTARTAHESAHSSESSGHLAEHGGFMPPLVDPGEAMDPVGRIVVISIAVVTLLAGTIGFGQADAFRNAEHQAHQAQHHSLEALAEDLSQDEKTQDELFRYALSVDARTALWSASQERLYWESVDATARAHESKLVEDERQIAADQSASLTSIKVGRVDGPLVYGSDGTIGDPYFPRRFVAEAGEGGLMHSALQDAANQASADMTGRGQTYTIGLAILAIALYFLGLSLILRTRLRWAFIGLAGALVLFSLVRVVPRAMSPPPVADDSAEAAAEAYARGMVGYESATSPAEFGDAVPHLREATIERPGFALAQFALADAKWQETSPQQVGLLSQVDPKTFDDLISTLRGARDACSPSTSTPLPSCELVATTVGVDLGFLLYRRAIEPSSTSGLPIDHAVLDESIATTWEALNLLQAHREATQMTDQMGGHMTSRSDHGDLAIAQLNLGVALLADDLPASARQAYAESVDSIRFVDALQTPRSEFDREQIVGGALTDLDNLGDRSPGLKTEIGAIKEDLVAGVWPPIGRATGKVTADVTIETFPSILQWRAQVAGAKLHDHSVVVQWYRRNAGGTEWYVQPDISGLITDSGQTNLWYAADVGRPANGYFGKALMTSSRLVRCWPAGDYRLELYIDGTLVGRAQQTIKEMSLLATDAPDLGVAFCRPQDWKARTTTEPGLVAAYGDAIDKRGIVIIRGHMPKPAVHGQAATAALLDLVLAEHAGALPPGFTKKSQDSSSDPFLSGDDPIWRWYTFGEDGEARVAAATTADGSVVVGLVYGPGTDFEDGGQALKVVESIIPDR